MRFTIRDILWVTMLIAMAIGWRLEYARNRFARTQLQGIVGALEAVGAEVEIETDHVRTKSSHGFDSYWGLGKRDPAKTHVILGAGSNQ